MKAPAAAKDEAAIRECMYTLVDALRAKDIDALMANYAAETVVFDLRPPPQIRGAAAYKRNFEAWFASTDGPIDYEVHDLRITARDDVGFCHSLCHVRRARTTGERADYWVRVTSGFQRMDGRWLVVHEHVSTPVGLESLQVSSNVEP